MALRWPSPGADVAHRCRWGELEFPLPFGRSMTSAEEYVHDLDGKTGASLKLSILNPKGRIWTMVAGGGASVIYADTVGDLGYAQELGNYAEYSGAPNTQVRLLRRLRETTPHENGALWKLESAACLAASRRRPVIFSMELYCVLVRNACVHAPASAPRKMLPLLAHKAAAYL